MGGLETSDALIARIAGAQHGVATRKELLAAGLTDRQIERRLQRGTLIAVHRGVYAVGHDALGPDGHRMAAVLSSGAGALLAHPSASVLWCFSDAEPLLPHVVAPRRARPPGVVTHRGRLTIADRAVVRGIPVTSPARTIVDAAHALDGDAFERLVREAQFRRLFDPGALREALTRRPSRALARLLDDLNPTQSVLEDAFLRLCRRHRIPPPRAQVRGRHHRPDFVWPGARLIVEVDSWAGHGTPRAFQVDRAQSNAAQLEGWMILRFTWADVTRRPAEVAAQVRRALGLHASEVS